MPTELDDMNRLRVRAERRVTELEALVHRAHNQFENITVADTLDAAKDLAHHGVAFTDDRGSDA